MATGAPSFVDTLLSLPIFHAGWVLYALVGLSVLSIGIMVERGLFYLRHSVDAEAVRRELARALDRGDLDAAATLLGRHDALETNAVLVGLQASAQGPESVEDLVSGALGRERARYERRLGVLATIASNAPYVGLFGTVLGIIRAFRDLSANMSNASASVMSGIAEALLATAIGLLVAIPAVAAYNAFRARVKQAVVECEMLARVLLSRLKAGEPRRAAE